VLWQRLLGGERPSLAHYVTGMGPMDGATAAGGRSCCLSSRDGQFEVDTADSLRAREVLRLAEEQPVDDAEQRRVGTDAETERRWSYRKAVPKRSWPATASRRHHVLEAPHGGFANLGSWRWAQRVFCTCSDTTGEPAPRAP
jgi:hypothetical protein